MRAAAMRTWAARIGVVALAVLGAAFFSHALARFRTTLGSLA